MRQFLIRQKKPNYLENKSVFYETVVRQFLIRQKKPNKSVFYETVMTYMFLIRQRSGLKIELKEFLELNELKLTVRLTLNLE